MRLTRTRRISTLLAIAALTLALASRENVVAAVPQPVRHYIFDRVASPQPQAASIGQEKEALQLPQSGPLPTSDGRRPETRLFLLDGQAYEGKPFDAAQGFTIEVVFRHFGQGSELGNDRPNGMVFAQGDGYWHGLRLYYQNDTDRMRFEMGRPQPKNAFGISSPIPVPRGVWQHVAVTWDRQQLRLYWNGVLVASTAYAEPYSPPNGPLRIGFADAGVGSLKLHVAEWLAFSEALPPELVAAHALSALPGPIAVSTVPEGSTQWATAWRTATEAAALGNWQQAEGQWTAMARDAALPQPVRCLAQFAAAVAKRQRSLTGGAIATWAMLAQDATAPAIVRQNAAAACLIPARGTIWALADPLVYRHMLQGQTALPEDQTLITLAAAEASLQRGDPKQAAQLWERLLVAGKLAEELQWDVAFRYADALSAAQEYDAARAAYRKLADDKATPAVLRSLALLAWATTYEKANAWTEAAGAYRQIAASPDLALVHRWEAEEAAREMERLANGLPRRDPNWHRTAPPSRPQPGVEIHLAPTGNDGNPGTASAPLASLEEARNRIRQLKQQGPLPAGGVTVWIHTGVYPRRATFELGEEDSGTAEAPIAYSAAEGESPVFTGGIVLTDFQSVRNPDVLKRLPEAARDKVLQVDLRSQDVSDFGSLGQRGFGLAGYPTHPWVDVYFNDQPGTLARWPNDGFVSIKNLATPSGDAGQGQPGAWTVEGPPLQWAPSDDIWMYGYWRYLWAGTTIRVAGIDRNTGRLTTAQGSGYGFAEGMPYYFFNVLEELDQPGEWYLDRQSGVLYFYPPADAKSLRVTMPLLAAPFVRTKNTSHLQLDKLTFECGRAEGVVIEGGTEVALLGCRILRLGTNGVVILDGSKHLVMGCDIGTVGAGGIRLRGGDEKTLTPSGHVVENCHVWDFTRVDRNYAPAAQVNGVGAVIRHNLFHDSPHQGMRLEGFQHLVEFNEVHSVVYESDDQAGLDMFGNPISRGNILRWNFWHHIGSGHNVAGQAGIRLDDMISGVTIYGNVFYRCAGGHFGGLQIHGGKDNLADNNLFIACKAAVSFSPWGESRWKERVNSYLENARRRGLDVSQPPLAEEYPDLLHLLENPNRNFILRSLAVSCGEFAIRDPGVNVFCENHVAEGDLGFVAPANRQFGLKPDSAVFRWFPFRAIPFSEIGLYPSAERATWPVQHTVSPKYVAE